MDSYHSSSETVSAEPHIIAVRYDNNKMTIYLDGVIKNTTTRQAHAVPFTVDEFIIGVCKSGMSESKRFIDGHVAEFMMFNDQIDDGFNQVHHYLAKKWGLAATIDSDGDGVMDSNEISNGTDPTDASSFPVAPLADENIIAMDDGSTMMIFKYNENFDTNGQTKYSIEFPDNVMADVLVVGGGGAGGGLQGGGGGAGAVMVKERIAMSGDFMVRVGRGGAGTVGSNVSGERGKDSQLLDATNAHGMTAIGGGGGGGYNGANALSGGSGGGRMAEALRLAVLRHPQLRMFANASIHGFIGGQYYNSVNANRAEWWRWWCHRCR